MSVYPRARCATWRISTESLMLFLICTADAVLTVFLITRGLATEANPLMELCFRSSVTTFYAAKLGPILLLTALAEWYRRHNPDFTRAALRAGIVAYLTLYFLAVFCVNFRV